MNEETLKRMPEYFQKLPKEVQGFVYANVWEERTLEIAKKYSLNPFQTDGLVETVLLILIGLETPDDLLTLLSTNMGISRLLTEQILEDLEVRVFEYAVKSIENKQKKDVGVSTPEAPQTPQTPTPTAMKPAIKTAIPEIRPEIVPLEVPQPESILKAPETKPAEVEKPAEKKMPLANILAVKSTIPTKPDPVAPKAEESKITKTVETPRIKYNHSEEVVKKPEVVQAPIPVPRFVATPMDEKEEVVTEPVVTNDLAKNPIASTENKLNIPTPPKKPEVTPEVPIKKAYAVDPYREPIE